MLYAPPTATAFQPLKFGMLPTFLALLTANISSALKPCTWTALPATSVQRFCVFAGCVVKSLLT